MFLPFPPHIRLLEDLDGYVRVYDTADWRLTLMDLQDAAGAPLDLTGARLTLQIRPYHLPNLIVADLASDTGGLVISDGPSVSLVSLAEDRAWVARETTTLIGDLMMIRDETATFLSRIHFTVSPGFTR